MSPVQQVMDLIDRLGDPKNGMSKQQWVDFCEKICDQCDSRAEAAKEEMRNEETP